VDIRSIRHKALKSFVRTGSPRGLPADAVPRLINIVAWLAVIRSGEEVRVPPNFGAHQLVGNRAREWSLSVTRNWRLTFWINDDGQIEDLNLEDYH
jgi:proteic killer suppression protein